MNIPNVSVFELNDRKSIKGLDFDFTLIFKKNEGLLKQKISKKLKKFLIERYKSNHSHNSPMDKSSHRKIHGFRLFKHIQKNYKKNLKDKKILEIGCGSGFLLGLFKKKNCEVLGIEPSNIKKDNDINIKKDFFLKTKIQSKFDIITSNAVLEHEFHPNKFLKKSYNDLKIGGMNFICVPDYTKLIRNGDPTLINHEHINYFTKSNLEYYLKKNKFIKVRVFSDKFGNLFGLGFKGEKKTNKTYKINLKKSQHSAHYVNKFYACVKKIDSWLDTENKDYNLGLYGATSAISTIFSQIKFKKKNIYIFDGDTQKQKKYIKTFPNEVFEPKEILKKRVKKIIILPYFYEKEIKNFLINDINFNSKNIKCLSNFF